MKSFWILKTEGVIEVESQLYFSYYTNGAAILNCSTYNRRIKEIPPTLSEIDDFSKFLNAVYATNDDKYTYSKVYYFVRDIQGNYHRINKRIKDMWMEEDSIKPVSSAATNGTPPGGYEWTYEHRTPRPGDWYLSKNGNPIRCTKPRGNSQKRHILRKL